MTTGRTLSALNGTNLTHTWLASGVVPTAERPGRHANKQRWRMAGAGCTGAERALRRVTGTHSSMAATAPRRLPAEAIASRREVTPLIRAMRAVAGDTEEASSGSARPINAKPRD
jgi:hypothetical protein